jgi:predicted nuclease with TOPRIM domain
MQSNNKFRFRFPSLTLFLLAGSLVGFAGVSRSIQEQYRRDYENKAMFLKIPIYSERQTIHISGQTVRAEQGSGLPRYKVGDQLRVLLIDFAGDEIKFRMGGIATPGFVEIGFKFDANLQETFPNRDVFDRALQSTFTEGLKYTDIENAKDSFVQEQFERSVREIADSASISRESVLKNIAPYVPAYQDAQREIENLKNRLQDVSGQLSQSQSENRKRESELRSLQAEFSQLKSSHAALQEKIESSASQVSRLGEELRDAKGTAQGYQKELANIQRSLNLKVDASRDLSMQIADLGQAMRKLQKDNDSLTAQAGSLQTNLDTQRATNVRLVRDNEELKSNNRQMQSTIDTLTSKEDSLARQYLNLQNAKEKLDDFSQSVRALRIRIAEEKTEGGIHSGKADVYLKSVLLGSLSWSFPSYLNHSAGQSGEVNFSAESIDYVRITPEERHILRSLGERLKMRVDLVSDSSTMAVKPEQNESVHEIGERDRSSWRWGITNQGTQDARLLLTARLINKNSDEISFIQQEYPVISSNMVRQARSYLQPIPLALGVLIGFLLFGIVGIFRRPKRGNAPGKPTAEGLSESHTHTERKQL